MSVTVAEQTLVGRITGGHVDDLSVAQVLTLLGLGASEIDAHEAVSPTAVQLAACRAATITNYGQAAADVNIILPTPVANLGALCTVSTAQAGNYWRMTCTGKIYLNGSATAKNYVEYTTPVVGYYFSFFTAKIADGSYAYYVSDGVGALATN